MTGQEKKKLPLSQKLIVGGIAGIVGASSTFPIDIVKTRLQSQKPDYVMNPSTGRTSAVYQYKGPMDCFRQILRREGLRGLYRGLPPTLVGIVPEKALKLAVNDVLREYFSQDHCHRETGELELRYQVLAAAGAGTCQVIATTPLEMIKIRKQTQVLLTTSAERNQSTRQLLQSLGFRGLYKGTWSTLCRDVPYGMIFFPLYATLKTHFHPITDTDECSPLSVITAGASAGALAAAIVTPMDVLKTRIQMKGAKYRGMVDCFQQLVKEEGVQGLTKGIFPRMMVQAPLFGITLLAFELQKQYMEGV